MFVWHSATLKLSLRSSHHIRYSLDEWGSRYAANIPGWFCYKAVDPTGILGDDQV